MSARGKTLSFEMRAQLISDAGAGLHPTSKVREAVKAEALKHLREVGGADKRPDHYGTGRAGARGSDD